MATVTFVNENLYCVYIQGNQYVDQTTLRKSLVDYNQVVCNDYVGASNLTRVGNDGEEQIHPPTNICEFSA